MTDVWTRTATAMLAITAAAGCSLLAPTDAELRGAGRDGGAVSGDGGDGGVGAEAGDPDGGATYAPLDAKDAWTTFDTTSLLASAHDYAGGTFDGTYVYFAPNGAAPALRYDTRAPFGDGQAWAVFDTKTVDGGAQSFTGAVFDGRYVYLVPYGDGHARVFARYDTQGAFTAAAAWTAFDSTSVRAGAEGFVGGTFDGRYLYFAPKASELNNASGIFTRYDARAPFTDKASWSTFDTSGLESTANGFGGAVFDGRWVTLVPFDNELPDSVAVRFDTTGSFGAATAYETFTLATIGPSLGGFFGGAFDARYVYFAPSRPAGAATVVRFDTTGSFATSWSRFDARKVAPTAGSFAGAAFDGRHVYLVPGAGPLVRYDTTGAFDGAAAWSSVDLGQVAPGAAGFTGAVFDGRALYLVPREGSRAARFEARTPGALPALPAFHGSFL